MAKRFTDTQKYHKPFIRGLQGAYKVLWDYLYHDCDHAGIWIVDFEIAQIYIGKDLPVNKSDAIKYFNSGEKRIIEINKGTKWFIPSFIEFQYGELNPENRAHKSVINILKKYNLYSDNKGLISSLQGAKDKDKDKDKDMDMDKDKESKAEIIYPWDDEKFIQVWEFWKKYKREQFRFTYKPIGETATINKLFELAGGDLGIAMLVIKQSIENGWSGLFELKGKFKTQEYDREKIFDDLQQS